MHMYKMRYYSWYLFCHYLVFESVTSLKVWHGEYWQTSTTKALPSIIHWKTKLQSLSLADVNQWLSPGLWFSSVEVRVSLWTFTSIPYFKTVIFPFSEKKVIQTWGCRCKLSCRTWNTLSNALGSSPKNVILLGAYGSKIWRSSSSSRCTDTPRPS